MALDDPVDQVPEGADAAGRDDRHIDQVGDGTWPADEFIEGIVDDQARNYSKRVLASFFAYTWLYDRRVPVMPNAIPPALVPTR